jgi:hypothetical protein
VIPLIPGITSLGAAMMGRQTGDQASLFFEFRLEARFRTITCFGASICLSAQYWTACASI